MLKLSFILVSFFGEYSLAQNLCYSKYQMSNAAMLYPMSTNTIESKYMVLKLSTTDTDFRLGLTSNPDILDHIYWDIVFGTKSTETNEQLYFQLSRRDISTNGYIVIEEVALNKTNLKFPWLENDFWISWENDINSLDRYISFGAGVEVNKSIIFQANYDDYVNFYDETLQVPKGNYDDIKFFTLSSPYGFDIDIGFDCSTQPKTNSPTKEIESDSDSRDTTRDTLQTLPNIFSTMAIDKVSQANNALNSWLLVVPVVLLFLCICCCCNLFCKKNIKDNDDEEGHITTSDRKSQIIPDDSNSNFLIQNYKPTQKRTVIHVIDDKMQCKQLDFKSVNKMANNKLKNIVSPSSNNESLEKMYDIIVPPSEYIDNFSSAEDRGKTITGGNVDLFNYNARSGEISPRHDISPNKAASYRIENVIDENNDSINDVKHLVGKSFLINVPPGSPMIRNNY